MNYKVKLLKIKKFLFENQNIKQTVLKNTFWLTFGNILGRLIKALLIIYAARVLGVAGYGTFSYVLTLAAFLSVFADLGISGIIIREGAKDHSKLPVFLSTAFYIKIVLVVVSAATVVFVAPFFTRIPEAVALLPLAALLIAVDSFRDFFISVSRSQERMEAEAGISVFTYVAITICGLIALFISPTAKNLILGYVAGSAIGTVFSIFLLRKYFTGIWHSYDKSLIKKIFVEGWLFALMGLLGGIMINTDTIMLGWLTNAKEVGYYSAAQRPILLLYIVPSILSSALFPALSRLAGKDKNKFQSVFEKSIKISLMVALPIVVGGIVLSSGIIQLLFGGNYLPSVTTFSILILTMLVVFPGTLIGNAIFAYNEHRFFVGFLAMGVISNAILNYFLINRWGIEGSAVATILAQMFANGLSFAKMKRINDFKVLIHLPKPLLAAMLMGILAWGLNVLGVNLLINIFLSAIAYFAVLYLIKEPLLRKDQIYGLIQ
jgi:O-antigen/teichoic acid export membrane protein